MSWQPIETAPRGNGDKIKYIKHPDHIEPPQILMLFEDGSMCVVKWDWYYAEGGMGHHHAQGGPAWVNWGFGELAHLYFGMPVRWMHLPPLPEEGKS